MPKIQLSGGSLWENSLECECFIMLHKTVSGWWLYIIGIHLITGLWSMQPRYVHYGALIPYQNKLLHVVNHEGSHRK